MKKPTTRAEARTHIIQAANSAKLDLYRRARHRRPEPRLFGPRQINEAVAMVRARRLVDGDVLELAGFRPHGPHRRAFTAAEAGRRLARVMRRAAA